ncbi:porin [Aliivibrio finisterrensis]|uniref:porin n=1 Tax=Aliivibrio finisterrensis TaxID=511998 RepID=UPI00101E8F45|nr:porin [Aliivibrio finisterrensis]RYU69487.1 porin [Aliivibrio finisterrensis]RYU73285.1 porin [Aliivibrio finisterrensis]RYU76239.1 porin [Aliivibrio finisterrensis]
MMTMFKKTLLGAAIAAATLVSGSANAAIQLAGDAVQVYGQAAGFMTVISDSDSENSAGAVIESRIGFRGTVEFEDFAPNLIWQVESGDANNNGAGAFGVRDTFVGLDFEDVGSFKFGRQLVAAYNYVDWPHTNPGLGNVFDWNNDLGVTFEDRADNNLRFDSANFGGFNFQATLSGMSTTTDAMVASIATSYTQDLFSVHAAYYTRGEYTSLASEEPKYIINDQGQVVDNPNYIKGGATTTHYANNYAIVGGSLFLGDVTLTAAYKMMETDTATGSNGQDAISATAQYILNNQWVFKGGYSMTTDADQDTDKLKKEDTGDTAITARLGYLLPSTYLYIDSRNYKMDNKDWSNSILVGAEYYF